ERWQAGIAGEDAAPQRRLVDLWRSGLDEHPTTWLARHGWEAEATETREHAQGLGRPMAAPPDRTPSGWLSDAPPALAAPIAPRDGYTGSGSASTTSRSLRNAARRIRETCICETPIRPAISDWDRSSTNRSLSTMRSRSLSTRVPAASVRRSSANAKPAS